MYFTTTSNMINFNCLVLIAKGTSLKIILPLLHFLITANNFKEILKVLKNIILFLYRKLCENYPIISKKACRKF